MSLLCLRRPGFWWKGPPSLSDPHEAEPVLNALNLGWWGLGRDPPPLLKAGAWLRHVAPADLGGGLRAGGEVAPTTLWVCLEHLVCCRRSRRVDGALAVWGARVQGHVRGAFPLGSCRAQSLHLSEEETRPGARKRFSRSPRCNGCRSSHCCAAGPSSDCLLAPLRPELAPGEGAVRQAVHPVFPVLPPIPSPPPLVGRWVRLGWSLPSKGS